MNIDLEGMLQNAADCLSDDTDVGGYRHTLPELGRNLRELRIRTQRGDMAALGEFFALYKVDDDTCPTCKGTGEIREAHESYAVETLGCPHCMGSGKKGGGT